MAFKNIDFLKRVKNHACLHLWHSFLTDSSLVVRDGHV